MLTPKYNFNFLNQISAFYKYEAKNFPLTVYLRKQGGGGVRQMSTLVYTEGEGVKNMMQFPDFFFNTS